MNIIKKITVKQIFLILYLIFIGVSFYTDFALGKTIGGNFKSFLWEMITILPPIFMLIGLFEVWVKKATQLTKKIS